MLIKKAFYRSLFLACLFMPFLAFAEEIPDQMIDKIDIVQNKSEAEIHINFFHQVHYLRHFPTNESSEFHIFLQSMPLRRQVLNSPPSDLVPSFTVRCPDQTANSLGIQFNKPIKFRVSLDHSGRGVVLHVPLEKTVETLAPEELELVGIPEAAPVEIPVIP